MPTIAIIDYGSGNLRSAHKAFERVAQDHATVKVSADPANLKAASHIVLPGVGAFADCMQGLCAVPGMLETLEEEVRQKKKWFMGICVGMQMMLSEGHEHGTHTGLGWIKGKVVRLDSRLKIPHMGWNELSITADHPLLKGVQTGAHAYFVHSYHAQCAHPADVIATTDYGQPVAAAIARDNLMGTQFHPEKSQETGLQLLRNFVEL